MTFSALDDFAFGDIIMDILNWTIFIAVIDISVRRGVILFIYPTISVYHIYSTFYQHMVCDREHNMFMFFHLNPHLATCRYLLPKYLHWRFPYNKFMMRK